LKLEDVWNGNECGKNRGDENLKVFIVSTVYITHKKKRKVKYFNYLCRKFANDGRYTREIKSMIIMSKAAINKEEAFFTNNLDLDLRKKQVKCYIWSIPLHGAEI
jgi:hypothetical protein